MVRLAASRTVAKAGTRMSSSVLPSASSFLNASVRARSSSSESFDQLRLERVDGVDPRLILAHAPVVGGAEQLAGDSADHCGSVPCLWQAADAAIHGEMRHFSGICNGIASIEQDRAAFET